MHASRFISSLDYTSGMPGRPALIVAGLFSMAVCSAEIGTKPRATASEYPAHIETQAASIGAEFMVRSFGRDTETYITDRYLTVEVGIYPANRKPVMVSNTRFTLRINGKKDVVFAATPSMVAASLKYSDWEQRPALEAQAGPIILGGNRPAARFPGDTRSQQGRYPAPGQVPADPSGVEKARVSPEELVDQVAIGEGETQFPVSGYVYFPYSGKMKSIRSLELIYNDGSQSVAIRLR
jgi:hypothetical protein